jgi:glutathione S-transferase
MSRNTTKLYALPGSHPCAAVEVALRMKGIDFQRVDLLPLSQLMIGPLRYGGSTVPGLRIDGERLVGSRTIMRRLDQLVPEPALLPPAGTPSYAQVLEAERWGDDVLQSVPRRILDLAFLSRPEAMLSYAGDAKLPLPKALQRPAAPLTARLMALKNKARQDAVRADLAALPAQLDRIDGWIADGLLGDDRPNAADLQIGSTIHLLLTLADVRPLIEGHPAAALARYFPPAVGEVPAGALPAEWVPAAPAAAGL